MSKYTAKPIMFPNKVDYAAAGLSYLGMMACGGLDLKKYHRPLSIIAPFFQGNIMFCQANLMQDAYARSISHSGYFYASNSAIIKSSIVTLVENTFNFATNNSNTAAVNISKFLLTTFICQFSSRCLERRQYLDSENKSCEATANAVYMLNIA